MPARKLWPLAASYVGYIVFCNLNLNWNPVGFYQISKIAVAPAVLAIEAGYYGKRASSNVVASIALVCAGVGLATVTDPQISSNLWGLTAGFGSIAATALYQIWAGARPWAGAGGAGRRRGHGRLAEHRGRLGEVDTALRCAPRGRPGEAPCARWGQEARGPRPEPRAAAHLPRLQRQAMPRRAGVKQKELGLGSMQLLHQYVPLAAIILALLVPLFEPMGWVEPTAHTVLGYSMSPGAAAAILASAVLGLLVNLSTFLVRGAAGGARHRSDPRSAAGVWAGTARPGAARGRLFGRAAARPLEGAGRGRPRRHRLAQPPPHPSSPLPALAEPPCPALPCQVIGATSSLTYNVVGHVKTVIILSGGVVFFGDSMPPKKVAGICVAMGGIVW